MEENTNKNPGNGQKQIAGAIIIVGVLIAGAIFFRGESPANNNLAQERENLPAGEIRPIGPDEHIFGNQKAEIVIVEYSDTECPFCKRFHDTMHQVIDSTDGNVAWVYRHFPIAQLHPEAFKQSLATECAWEQGGNETFWTYIDELYRRTPSNNGLQASELSKIATDIGLNLAQFDECLTSEKYADKVRADMEDGNKMGISGTPSSIILKKGEIVDVIPGAQPYEAVMEKINNLL